MDPVALIGALSGLVAAVGAAVAIVIKARPHSEPPLAPATPPISAATSPHAEDADWPHPAQEKLTTAVTAEKKKKPPATTQ